MPAKTRSALLLAAALALATSAFAADDKKDAPKPADPAAAPKPADPKPAPQTKTTEAVKAPDPKPATPAPEGRSFNSPSGVKITVAAEAKEAGAQAGDIVWVHYTGKLPSGEQFDSSVGKTPFKLTLGKGEVIKGWDEGLVGMKIGEKRRLDIPAPLGYAEKGTPDGKIPPNSPLVFDVEMIGIARPGNQ